MSREKSLIGGHVGTRSVLTPLGCGGEYGPDRNSNFSGSRLALNP
jgi:hypothetical protein